MNYKKIKLQKLKPYHLNCKIHNKKNIEAIKLSLKKFKQYKPLIVNELTNEIIVGNGTFQALKQLNIKTATVVFMNLSKEKQKVLNILDNKSSELSTWTEQLLEKIENFNEQFFQTLDFEQDFLKSLEPIEKINQNKLENFEQSDILNDDDTKISINAGTFIKCPCCEKEFLKQ